jgi:hypothetical protein
MDFSSISSSTIDTCPHPSVKQLTLLFDELELREATYTQFERFFRVWFTDTKEYAPRLTSLIVILRASRIDNQINTNGIQEFLKYFIDNVVHKLSDLKYEIYIDNYASVSRFERSQIIPNPLRIRSNV